MLTQRKALVLVVFVLLGCAMLNTRWTSWLALPVTHTVNTLQYPADFVAHQLKREQQSDTPDQSKQELEALLYAARQQNEALWIEVDKLNDQIASFQAIQEIRDMKSIQMVEARVSRFDRAPTNPRLHILRGSLHGLKPDDAVAFRSNLIGFVSATIGPVNTTVSLITGEGFSIGAQIKPPPDKENPNQPLAPGWPFKTRVHSDGRGGFFVELDNDIAEELRVGDEVRAADTIRESANGLMLGLIEKIEPANEDPLNLSRVTIRPRTLIGPQRMVTVLTERND